MTDVWLCSAIRGLQADNADWPVDALRRTPTVLTAVLGRWTRSARYFARGRGRRAILDRCRVFFSSWPAWLLSPHADRPFRSLIQLEAVYPNKNQKSRSFRMGISGWGPEGRGRWGERRGRRWEGRTARVTARQTRRLWLRRRVEPALQSRNGRNGWIEATLGQELGVWPCLGTRLLIESAWRYVGSLPVSLLRPS